MLPNMDEGTGALAQFGQALSAQMGQLTRGQLAARVTQESGESVSESAVALWLGGKSEPSRVKVFAIERVLGLPGGTLSRLLGYLPVDARSTRTVPEAIDADPDLSDDAKAILRAAYRGARRA